MAKYQNRKKSNSVRRSKLLLSRAGRNPVGALGAVVVLLTVAIGGYVAVHFSRAATPISNLPLCPTTITNPSTISCRPLIGAASYGNPGTPANKLPQGDVNNSGYQFNYLQGLIGPQSGSHPFKFNVYRDYHCVYGGDACTASGSSLGSFDQTFASQGYDLNINWIPSPDWNPYPHWTGTPSAQQISQFQSQNPTLYSEIVQAAASFKSIPATPIFLTVWHEMNLHVTTSGVSGCQANGTAGIGTPAQFINAWQDIHDIFKQQGVTNVIWDMNYAGGSHSCLAPLMWPGDTYVDWVTWDTYSRGKDFANSAGNFYSSLKTENGQKSAFGVPADFTQKPWGIGEFGTCRQPSGQEGEAAYFDSVESSIQSNSFPLLHMYEIYANNAEGNGSGCLSDYDTDAADPGGNGGPYDPCKQQAVNDLFAYIEGTSSNAVSGCRNTPTPTPPTHTPTSTPPPTSSPTSPSPGPITTGGSGSSGGSSDVVVGPPGSQVSVDGVPASGNGQLDTSYLTNGQHTLSVNSNGKTTTETINVQNHLNPFQNLRNFLFAHITQNHLLMNAGTVSLLLLPPIVLLVIFRTRIVGLLGHIRKPVTL